jgi:hypothetical protein
VAIIVFSRPVSLPIAPIREQLTKHLPLYRWQVGEDDTGEPKQMGVFKPDGMILGRTATSVIFTEYRATLGTVPNAPPHEWYLELFQPTTELKPIADRITVITCMIAMILDEDNAHCQLLPGGNWLTAKDLLRVFQAVLNGEDIGVAAGIGTPPSALAGGVPRSAGLAPRASIDNAMAGKRMLPHLTVLLDRPLRYDGDDLLRVVRQLDEDGGWELQRSSGNQVALIGRGTLIGVLDIPEPMPADMVTGGWTRSFWFQGDRTAVDRHRTHICVTTQLDTAAAEWVTVRQVAKVMTLVAAWLARLPGAVALHNTGPGITFAASEASRFLSILARDQLPVMLWTWTKPHSIEDGNVCLSTSGLMPFLGHELEVWNAPLPVDEVNEQMSGLIVYLLDQGAVIGHGDTAGRTKGDKSIRCFLGPSRAERPESVPALFLEFEGPEASAPKPDLPAKPDAPMRASTEGVLRDFVARIGPNDITGTSDVIRDMLEKNEAAKDAARATEGKPLDPKFAVSDRLLRELKKDADATSAQALEAMQEALRNPPPPDVIASAENPFFTNLKKFIEHEQDTGALPKPEPVREPTLVSWLALTKPIGLPRHDMLRELNDRITGYRWSCDESPNGLNEPRLLTGVGLKDQVSVQIVAATAPLPPEMGAPLHGQHIRVDVETGDDRSLAGRIAAVVCACLPLGQDPQAHGRLSPQSRWMSADDLLTAMSVAKFAPSMKAIAPDLETRTLPAMSEAPLRPLPPLRRAGGFGRKGL